MILPDSEYKDEWQNHPYTRDVLRPLAANDVRMSFAVLCQAAAKSQDVVVGQAYTQLLAALEMAKAVGVQPEELKILLENVHG